jgi:hypothetical protein
MTTRNKGRKRSSGKKPVGPIPQGDVAARMRKYRSKGSDIEIEPYRWEDKKHRVATYLDFRGFCSHYLKGMFRVPDGQDEIESKERIQHAVLNGGLQAEAAARGAGKTQRAKAGGLWAVLNGHWHFVAMIAATGALGKQLLDDILKELVDNDRLAADWPEICLPMREAYGKPQRARHITINGNPCRLECSSNRIVLPTSGVCIGAPKPYESSVMMSAGITSSIRGLRFTTSDGQTLRPDGALIDDVQNRKTAKSGIGVDKIMSTIRGDIMRLGGMEKEVAILAMVTVIYPKDAADKLLDHKECPEWRGIRKKMVQQWPKSKKWDTYMELYAQCLLRGDVTEATAFYVANRSEMDDGAVVSWPARTEGRLSGIQLAYDLRVKMKEAAFAAECQNEPLEASSIVVRFTADTVLNRCNGLAQGEVPPLSCITTAFIDVNDHALAWAVGAFTKEMSGAVVAYGEWGMNGPGQIGQLDRADRIWDENKPSPEGKEKRFWTALDALGTHLFSDGLLTMQGRSVRISAMLIDYGYNLLKDSQLIQNWCHSMQVKRLPVYPSRGWGSSNFPKPSTEKTLWDSVTFGRKDFWTVRVYTLPNNIQLQTVHHDAEHHRRELQLAFLAPPGSPGSMTIWGVPGNGPGADGMKHLAFAKQVAGVKLVQYSAPTAARYSGQYTWEYTPGLRNEMSDVTVGCRVAAMAFAYTQGMIGGTATGAPVDGKTPTSPVGTPNPSVPPPKPVPQMPRVAPGWGGNPGGTRTGF